MNNIYGLTLEQLRANVINLGYKKFVADQIFDWLYKKQVSEYSLMTNLKNETLENISNIYSIDKLNILECQKDEGVVKYLFELADSQKIEAVLMYHDYGNSLCISTQVGCNMDCGFCESGRLKKVRDLEVHEMVLQILQIEKDLNIKITHIVLMGIGEPFDNYNNVINFIEVVNDPKGIELGSRHITISTCGIIPKIKEFSEYDKQVNLAISLHASNDDIRSKLMPINKAYNISDLIETVKEYIIKTNRRVTFEYIMLDGLNDSIECANELSKLLRGINCYVNLIPYNETSNTIYKKSNKNTIMQFYDTLKKNNINVTVRKEFGSKVSAACGQLRANYEEGK